MNNSTPLDEPQVDPTILFELFRGSYGSELLTVAVAHLDVFARLSRKPCTRVELADVLGLAERPTIVLTTALLAMGLLHLDQNGVLSTSQLAQEHLVPDAIFDVGNYIGLAASAPGVLEMLERLRTNSPAGLNDEGAAFIYRSGIKSAMEQAGLAEHFTLALAGRAKNVAPYLAKAVSLEGCRTMLDVGGGTGIYSIGLLKQNPSLKAVVFDRPEVLNTARQFAVDYGIADRISFQSGDMFADQLPNADVILLSNILHDWDVPVCRDLVARCAKALNPGGRLLVHDVLLNDQLTGPLPIALYSAALFTLTEGRAYSAAEISTWMSAVGLRVSEPIATLIHCHVIEGARPVVE